MTVLAIVLFATSCAVDDEWAGPTADQIELPQAPIALVAERPPTVDLDGDGIEVVTVEAQASYDPDGQIVQYAWSDGLETIGTGPTLTGQFPVGESVVLLTVTDDDGQIDFLSVPVSVLSPSTQDPGAPSISLWSGRVMDMGQGDAQRWVNLPGNAMDEDGIASVRFRLNNDDPEPVSLGPNDRRLVRDGDFVIDIERDRLQDGVNVIVIEAIDRNSLSATEVVVVDRGALDVPELPLVVDWAVEGEPAGALTEIIDGDWDVVGGVAAISQEAAGYERLLAIGSTAWTDYEVEFTATALSLRPGALVSPSSLSPSLGVFIRWQGHNNSIARGSRPQQGFVADDSDDPTPMGASVIAAWQPALGALVPEIRNQAFRPDEFDQENLLRLNTTYRFLVQVQTVTGGSIYRAKIWRDGAVEPTDWQLVHVAGSTDLQARAGSIVLQANEIVAEFGSVEVREVAASDRLRGTIADLLEEFG